MNLPSLGASTSLRHNPDDTTTPLGSTVQSLFSKADSNTCLLAHQRTDTRQTDVLEGIDDEDGTPTPTTATSGSPLYNGNDSEVFYGTVNLRAPFGDEESVNRSPNAPIDGDPQPPDDDGKFAATASGDSIDSGSPTSNTDELRLYHIDDIPDRLKDNHHIHNSYRAYYTLKMCVRSLWHLHNETVNIWTHLLGLLIFIGLFGWFLADDVVPTERRVAHYVILFAFSTGLVICLSCSTLFHLTNAHYSSKFCKLMHKLDYFGITTLVIGSFVPMVFLGFACSPIWKYVYLSIVLTMGSFGLIGPWFHFWTELKYRTFRVIVYLILGGSGVFPLIHVNFILPVSQTWPYTTGLAIEIMIYFLGLMIYAFQVPERWFPGRFDIWCHSHQIWHMFVNAAAFTHFAAIAFMYRNWKYLPYEC